MILYIDLIQYVRMSEITEFQRSTGKEALGTVLTLTKNIDILEKNIYTVSKDFDQYQDTIMSVVTKIHNGAKLNKTLQDIKKKQIGFNSNCFTDVQQLITEQHNFIENPFEVEEGVLQCNKCGSKKTFSFSKQTRGGDEGTTVFAQCANCGARWNT